MTIGSELQQAREARGLTLVEVSKRTKIRVLALRAIERDDFQQLPGGVISRGFLKLYAREVGLDAEDIGRRFAAGSESDGPRNHGDVGAAGHGTSGLFSDMDRGSSLPRAAAVALAVLVFLGIGYFTLRPSPGPASGTEADSESVAGSGRAADQTSPASKAGAPASPTTTPPGAISTGPAETSPAATGTSDDVLRVDLHATGACWVAVTTDGQLVASRVMNAGERLAIRATNEAVLRIGIPANLTVTINDEPLPPSARPGTPVTLRITPANYRDLLDR